MKRIIIHWTAGAYQPNEIDYNHYHYLITGDGLVLKGKFSPLANEVCRAAKNKNALYAAHCGGGNTGSIGIAMCGMLGFKNSKCVGDYPLKSKQVEACFAQIAKLCREYKIPITPETVMTHYEFGQKNPNTTSNGKIDIIYLPPYSNVVKNQLGDFIRNKVIWYYNSK